MGGCVSVNNTANSARDSREEHRHRGSQRRTRSTNRHHTHDPSDEEGGSDAPFASPLATPQRPHPPPAHHNTNRPHHHERSSPPTPSVRRKHSSTSPPPARETSNTNHPNGNALLNTSNISSPSSSNSKPFRGRREQHLMEQSDSHISGSDDSPPHLSPDGPTPGGKLSRHRFKSTDFTTSTSTPGATHSIGYETLSQGPKDGFSNNTSSSSLHPPEHPMVQNASFGSSQAGQQGASPIGGSGLVNTSNSSLSFSTNNSRTGVPALHSNNKMAINLDMSMEVKMDSAMLTSTQGSSVLRGDASSSPPQPITTPSDILLQRTVSSRSSTGIDPTMTTSSGGGGMMKTVVSSEFSDSRGGTPHSSGGTSNITSPPQVLPIVRCVASQQPLSISVEGSEESDGSPNTPNNACEDAEDGGFSLPTPKRVRKGVKREPLAVPRRVKEERAAMLLKEKGESFDIPAQLPPLEERKPITPRVRTVDEVEQERLMIRGIELLPTDGVKGYGDEDDHMMVVRDWKHGQPHAPSESDKQGSGEDVGSGSGSNPRSKGVHFGLVSEVHLSSSTVPDEAKRKSTKIPASSSAIKARKPSTAAGILGADPATTTPQDEEEILSPVGRLAEANSAAENRSEQEDDFEFPLQKPTLRALDASVTTSSCGERRPSDSSAGAPSTSPTTPSTTFAATSHHNNSSTDTRTTSSTEGMGSSTASYSSVRRFQKEYQKAQQAATVGGVLRSQSKYPSEPASPSLGAANDPLKSTKQRGESSTGVVSESEEILTCPQTTDSSPTVPFPPPIEIRGGGLCEGDSVKKEPESPATAPTSKPEQSNSDDQPRPQNNPTAERLASSALPNSPPTFAMDSFMRSVGDGATFFQPPVAIAIQQPMPQQSTSGMSGSDVVGSSTGQQNFSINSTDEGVHSSAVPSVHDGPQSRQGSF